MKALTSLLAQIVELAIEKPLHEFPWEAMHLLRRLVHFDGGMICICENGDQGKGLNILRSWVMNRGPSLPDDYSKVSALDPVTARFLLGHDEPLGLNCASFYAAEGNAQLERFASKHRISQLLLVGSSPQETGATEWIFLFRDSEQEFNAEDAEFLDAAWIHVRQALRLNRILCLRDLEHGSSTRCEAIIGTRGPVRAPHDSLQRPWLQGWPRDSMRARAVARVLPQSEDASYSTIEITPPKEAGQVRSKIEPDYEMKGLTPSERVVAELFAAGLTNRQIADELNVSQNTIRTHIAHAYAKLGVHNKAALATYINGGRSGKPARRWS